MMAIYEVLFRGHSTLFENVDNLGVAMIGGGCLSSPALAWHDSNLSNADASTNAQPSLDRRGPTCCLSLGCQKRIRFISSS